MFHCPVRLKVSRQFSPPTTPSSVLRLCMITLCNMLMQHPNILEDLLVYLKPDKKCSLAQHKSCLICTFNFNHGDRKQNTVVYRRS